MSEADLVGEAVAGVLRRHCGPENFTYSEEKGWDEAAWRALAELGYPWVSVASEQGGSGGSIEDAISVLLEVGRFAFSGPVAETSLLGGWLLAAAGMQIPDGPISVVVGNTPSDLSFQRTAEGWVMKGVVRGCAWASVAECVLVLSPVIGGDSSTGEHLLVAVPRSSLHIIQHRNLAGELRDVVHFDQLVDNSSIAEVPSEITPEALRGRAALARAAMMAGAMLRIEEMTLAYAETRQQFGRPIRQFQSVSQSLALLAEAAACAEVAVRAAAVDPFGPSSESAGLSKITACLSADTVANRAHQIHAAIGMTEEYPLQRYTRRLYSWAAEYGSERSWSEEIGGDLLARGHLELWPYISRTKSGEGQ
jgi:acyl-CoA dehydrogenase